MSYAGYLINNSFTDWANSPISTTVSTHPIDELPFPAVTVCPPEGANTGLNYDLMKADEGSLTLENRKEIQNFTKCLFEDKEAKAFTEELIELINQKSLLALYNSENIQNVDVGKAGFYLEKNNTFHFDTTTTSGRLTSPWHGKIPPEGAASKPWSNRYTINFPSKEDNWLGNGTLSLKLDFNKNGTNADLVEIGSVTFTHYMQEKNWTAAEEHCVSKGGHLASVLSRIEMRAMFATCTASNCNSWWMGARKINNGNFEWVDGEEWGFVDVSKMHDDDECVMYYRSSYSTDGQIQTAMNCETKRSFMCVNRNMKRTSETGGNEILYDSENITDITLWWKHNGNGKENMMSSEFRLEWKIEDEEKEPSHRIERRPNWFTKIANLVVQNEQQQAPKSEHELWDLFGRAKLEYLSQNLFKCKYGQTYVDKIILPAVRTNHIRCELTGSCYGTFDAEPKYVHNITEGQLLLGFQLYSYLLSCPRSAAPSNYVNKWILPETKLSAMKEARRLSNFTFNLLNNSSPRTIIQAVRNTLQSQAIKYNLDLFKQFYHKLDE